jgi:HEAT repeat protein
MRRPLPVLVVIAALACGARVGAQAPAAVTAVEIASAIDKLGTLDLSVRIEAARTVRRAASELAVPALVRAARSHADGYVRYRALVLLSGFGGAPARDTMRGLLSDRDDRVRSVVCVWFEHAPDPAVLPALIAALGEEHAPFVRPALTRAIAAAGSDPRAQAALVPLVMKGEDAFRGAVIEALGEYHATYALRAIAEVAALDGPLQDDAVTAIGRLGDRSMLATLAALQRSAPPTVQAAIAAAVCLMNVDCAAQQDYLRQAIAYAASAAGNQALLGAAAHALGVLAASGRNEAFAALLDAGAPARDPARAVIAWSVGSAALRNPGIVLSVLESRADRDAVADLIRDAFDMLSEEDAEQERFFVEVRKAYWAAPAGSPRRQVAAMLIDKLEF